MYRMYTNGYFGMKRENLYINFCLTKLKVFRVILVADKYTIQIELIYQYCERELQRL